MLALQSVSRTFNLVLISPGRLSLLGAGTSCTQSEGNQPVRPFTVPSQYPPSPTLNTETDKRTEIFYIFVVMNWDADPIHFTFFGKPLSFSSTSPLNNRLNFFSVNYIAAAWLEIYITKNYSNIALLNNNMTRFHWLLLLRRVEIVQHVKILSFSHLWLCPPCSARALGLHWQSGHEWPRTLVLELRCTCASSDPHRHPPRSHCRKTSAVSALENQEIRLSGTLWKNKWDNIQPVRPHQRQLSHANLSYQQ